METGVLFKEDIVQRGHGSVPDGKLLLQFSSLYFLFPSHSEAAHQVEQSNYDTFPSGVLLLLTGMECGRGQGTGRLFHTNVPAQPIHASDSAHAPH